MNTLKIPKKTIKKVDSKENLYKLLDNYWGILDSRIIDYLNSLIELKFSVIRKNISEKDRKALSELEIYRKVAIYNIYNNALNMFNNEDLRLDIYSNLDNYEGIKVNAVIDDEIVSLFNFNYSDKSNIGNISIYKTIDNYKQLKYELEKLKKQIYELKEDRCPYPNTDKSEILPNVYGSPDSYWTFEHEKEIKNLEEIQNKLLERLNSNKQLTNTEKKKIAITNLINQKIINEYGLKDSDFKKEDSSKKDIFRKVYVKSMPNLTIKNNIDTII